MARRKGISSIDHLATLSDDTADAIGSDIPQILTQLDSLPPITCNANADSPSQAVLAGMLAGLKNWQQGLLEPAAQCFRLAASTKLSANDQWVDHYQKLASNYLADHHVLTGPLFGSMPVSISTCEQRIADLNRAADSLKTIGRARYNIRARQLDLAKQVKELRDREEN